jgi:hypothetical protein
MVEKPSDTEGFSTRATAIAAGLAPIRTDSLDDDESDDDISEADEDLASQGTDDTQVVSNLNVQGMAVLISLDASLNLPKRLRVTPFYAGIF